MCVLYLKVSTTSIVFKLVVLKRENFPCKEAISGQHVPRRFVVHFVQSSVASSHYQPVKSIPEKKKSSFAHEPASPSLIFLFFFKCTHSTFVFIIFSLNLYTLCLFPFSQPTLNGAELWTASLAIEWYGGGRARKAIERSSKKRAKRTWATWSVSAGHIETHFTQALSKCNVKFSVGSILFIIYCNSTGVSKVAAASRASSVPFPFSHHLVLHQMYGRRERGKTASATMQRPPLASVLVQSPKRAQAYTHNHI